MSLDQELASTAIVSMKATANYVLSRILDADGREAYTTAMKDCINYLDFYGTGGLHALTENIKDTQEEVELYKKQFSIFKKDKMARYYLMACSHALDVVNSLETRFIIGSSGTDLKLANRKGLFTYENKSVF